MPEDRRFAEPGLAEQHGEQFALHPAGQLGNLFFAAVEILAGFLGERGEAEPGVLLVDFGVAGVGGVVCG